MPTYVKILYAIGGFIIITAVSPILGWSLSGLRSSDVPVHYTDTAGRRHTVQSSELDSQKLSYDALNGRISTQDDAYVIDKAPWWQSVLGGDDSTSKPTVRKGGFGGVSTCKSGGGAKFCSSGG